MIPVAIFYGFLLHKLSLLRNPFSKIKEIIRNNQDCPA